VDSDPLDTDPADTDLTDTSTTRVAVGPCDGNVFFDVSETSVTLDWSRVTHDVFGVPMAPEEITWIMEDTVWQFAEQKLAIFPRIEYKSEAKVEGADAKSVTKTAESEQLAKSVATVSESGVIDIADFGKIDLRVAKILSAEKVEKADKLLKLQVELGSETRQVIAGIAAHYKPEDLVGKKIILVANLKPAKIRGIESYGMLLAAKDGEKLFVITPDGEIGSGAKVG
jgi:methionine--tRNA ligase beta chain